MYKIKNTSLINIYGKLKLTTDSVVPPPIIPVAVPPVRVGVSVPKTTTPSPIP